MVGILDMKTKLPSLERQSYMNEKVLSQPIVGSLKVIGKKSLMDRRLTSFLQSSLFDGGSAGITFNPGESLGDKYTNKFMYSAYQLGIHAFNFVPKGSGLQKKESEKFFGVVVLIMDTEFDYDGRFYVADYVASNDYKDGRPKGSDLCFEK